MFGNGVRTGMVAIAAIARRIHQVLLQALTACTVVAVGATARGTALCRSGTTPRLATRTSTSACASPYSSFLKKHSTLWLTLQKGGPKPLKSKVCYNVAKQNKMMKKVILFNNRDGLLRMGGGRLSLSKPMGIIPMWLR